MGFEVGNVAPFFFFSVAVRSAHGYVCALLRFCYAKGETF